MEKRGRQGEWWYRRRNKEKHACLSAEAGGPECGGAWVLACSLAQSAGMQFAQAGLKAEQGQIVAGGRNLVIFQ